VRLALEILSLVLGGIVMLIVLPSAPQRRRRGACTPGPRAPEDLERLERLVVTGRSSAGEVHLRLRPLLVQIATARLSRDGIRLERMPDRAQAQLGPELWDLVRPDRPKPEDMRGPGISLEQLAAMTERLGRL
jgi:hypothetical protein